MQRTMTRHNDVETSLMAAEKLLPHISQLQKEVLSAIRRRWRETGHGVTDGELELFPDFGRCGRSTVRKRRGELVRKGYLEATGEIRNGMKVWRPVLVVELLERKRREAAGLLF